MKKRIFSMMLVVCMVFTLFPTAAFATEDNTGSVIDSSYTAAMPRATSSVVNVGGEKLDITNPYLVNGKAASSGTLGSGGCTAHFDAQTVTLTLENANISAEYSKNNNAIDINGADLNVILKGKNVVTSNKTSGGAFVTVTGGDITFKGDGSLKAEADYAIYVFDNLIVEGGTIEAIGKSGGLCSNGSNGGTIKISGGDVTAVSTSGNNAIQSKGTVEIDKTRNIYVSDNADGMGATLANAADSATWTKQYIRIVEPVVGSVTLKVEATTANDYAIRTEGATYKTVNGAIAKAESGDTIQLISDITEDVEIHQNKDYTIDLNGHTLSNYTTTLLPKSTIQHQGSGELTIKDSAGGGKVDSNSADYGTISCISGGGTLTIVSGTVTATARNVVRAIYSDAGSTVNVQGGTVSATILYSEGGYGAAIYSDGPVNITGGTVSCKTSDDRLRTIGISNYSGTMNISGDASVTATGCAIDTSTGKVTVSGGANVSSDKKAIIIRDGGTVTVNGGTVHTANAGSPAISNIKDIGGDIIINGGNINSINKGNGTLKNAKGTDIYKVAFTEPAGNTGKVFAVTKAAGATYSYDLKESVHIGNDWCVWLPLGEATATYDGITYTATVTAEEDGVVFAVPVTVTSVAVSPKTASVQQGKTQQFSAVVTGTNSPAQTVDWTVTGGKAGTSINKSGSLIVAADETATNLTVKATSTVDSTKSDTATVTVTTTPVTKYILTVTDGNGGGSFEENAVVSITANTPPSGKVFDKWTSADGVAFTDANAATTTISMPAKAVTVTATYKSAPAKEYIVYFEAQGGNVSPANVTTVGGKLANLLTPAKSEYNFVGWFTAASGGIQVTTSTVFTMDTTIYAQWTYIGGNGSTGDSGEATGGESKTTSPKLIQKGHTQPTTGGIKTPAAGKNGNVSVTVTDKTVSEAIKKALAEDKKNSTQKNGVSIELNVDTDEQKADSITTNLPKTVQDILVKENVADFKIESKAVNMNFDKEALQQIRAQAGGDAQINASKADVSKLSEEAKKKIGNRPVFNLSITGKDGKIISDFGGGYVTVEIPYTLQPGEKTNNLQAYFVDAKGKLHEVICTYDPIRKCLVFVTNHFSVYSIGYKENVPKFNDIEKHWAKNDIEFVSARGLLSGTDKTTFSPNAAITRKDFASALAKLSGKDVSKIIKNSDKNQTISRLEMAEIMFNFSKFTNYNLLKTREKINFSDITSDIVTSLQVAGVIMGKDGNRYDPTGNATRAEVSAVLRRYVELVIDKATAQGLDMNDSGKIVYYENGKPFTGTKTINGTTYNFGTELKIPQK